jgi:hypothetical protein
MKIFQPTFFYIKQHMVTGKLYCGKTTRDPFKYLGSGLYWRRHIRKHGEVHVATLYVELFTEKDLLTEFAIDFSTKMKIVESACWANLKLENGLDGGTDKGHRKGIPSKRKGTGKPKPPSTMKQAMVARSEAYTGSGNPFFGKKHREESKRFGDNNSSKRPEVREKMSGPRPGFMPHNHYSGWSDEVKQKIAKSLTGKPQTEESRANKRAAKQDLIWVYNGVDKPKQVKSFQLPDYEQQGYKRGRGPTHLW